MNVCFDDLCHGDKSGMLVHVLTDVEFVFY